MNAFYCCFAAWSRQTNLVTYDEFLYSESDSAARVDFELKIAKKFGADWRDMQHDVMIRNLSRIVTAMVATERERGQEAGSKVAGFDPGV